MKRKFLFVLLVVAILMSLSCVAYAAKPKPQASFSARPRLTIRPFANKTNTNVPVDAITDMFTTELGNAGIFNLLERERLDYIGDEIRLGQSGLMDQSTAPQVGRLKGSEYILTGAVTLYHYNVKGGAAGLRIIGGAAAAKTAYVTLDIRIIDNTTGELVYVNSEQGSSKREIGAAGAGYKGFFIGGAGGSYGGILAAATRDAVIKHVNEMNQYDWTD
ncbi:MAG: hypothetical protein IJS40_01430 [Synergistaceae bacterium]|nr:hypothetical protein [Synergistaceae bacterium]